MSETAQWNAVLGVDLVAGRLELNPPPPPNNDLTEAQRAQQEAKLKREIQQSIKHSITYADKIAQFNQKLAKQKDANEMPNLSG
ncbi:hypothetical protein BASA82_000002 [Batrachochytrium salamandrivorans]|nr:hypothetical protein BASA81_000309 [Batrachochytrium salamandrivorans]KAH9262979.1 hypothetical protein BASA82_000002 [Batrachochytrium salamandrivorans]